RLRPTRAAAGERLGSLADFEVQLGSEQVHRNVVAGVRSAGRRRATDVPEIGMQILGLHYELAAERLLQATPDRPPGVPLLARRREADRGSNLAVGDASRHIGGDP